MLNAVTGEHLDSSIIALEGHRNGKLAPGSRENCVRPFVVSEVLDSLQELTLCCIEGWMAVQSDVSK